MNCKIHPILYKYFLILKKKLGAQIVHRRKRTSSTSIEIYFLNTLIKDISGRFNTLKEAEFCGFWIICRKQTSPKHAIYKDHQVYQLFLTPVHPKKQHEINQTIEPLIDIESLAMTA